MAFCTDGGGGTAVAFCADVGGGGTSVAFDVDGEVTFVVFDVGGGDGGGGDEYSPDTSTGVARLVVVPSPRWP